MRTHMSELARMRAHFTRQGWNPDDLNQFRMMADDDGSDGGDGDVGNDGDSGDGDDEGQLGEAGQRALTKEREAARKAKAALKPWNALGKELGLTPDQIREAVTKAATSTAEGGEQVDADAIRRDADRQANEKANARIVRAEVKVLAADLFADPADAALYLDLSKYDVDDDGAVDEDAIKADLVDVLKSKPHLAKTGKGMKPDLSQGARGAVKKESTPGLGRLRDAYDELAHK